jgi:hypothetical protein
VELVDRLRKVDRDFFQKFNTEKFKRKKILSLLSQVTSEKNIHFSAFHKVAHVTDATDWRVEYPEVVVYPENSSEIIGLVKAAKELGLKIIPRGGAHGLTGGAIPVYPNTMVINLEKLRNIARLNLLNLEIKTIPVVETEAGVITEEVTHYCKEQDIFLLQIQHLHGINYWRKYCRECRREKMCNVGTAIDNIFSFKIVNSEGHLLEVVRRDHPHRKIEPDDEVIFDVYQLHRKREKNYIKTISLKGPEIRKSGVGKDITNKALKGCLEFKKGWRWYYSICKVYYTDPLNIAEQSVLNFLALT